MHKQKNINVNNVDLEFKKECKKFVEEEIYLSIRVVEQRLAYIGVGTLTSCTQWPTTVLYQKKKSLLAPKAFST